MRGEEVPRKRLVCKCGFELQLHVSEAEYERHRRSKAHTALGRPSSSGRGLSGCFSSCLPSGAPSSTSRRPSLFGASSQVAAVNAEARARAAREMQRVEAAFSEATAAATAEGEALATAADEQERQLQQKLHTAKASATAAAETARAVAKAESKAVETILPAMVKGVTAAAAREQKAESATLALAAESARRFVAGFEREIAAAQSHAEAALKSFLRLEGAAEKALVAEQAAAQAGVQADYAKACNTTAEAQLLLYKARAEAKLKMMQAELLIARRHAAEQDVELEACFERLSEFQSMPDYVCAIASAYKAGHFTDFELTLLRQLGKAGASIVQRQGHDKEILAVLGLVATGSGMAGADLLHKKAPRLFPAKRKLYEEISKEWSPPVLKRDLSGLPGATLRDAMSNAALHMRSEGYSGPLVMGHDSTAVKPTADVRTLMIDGEKWLEVRATHKTRQPNAHPISPSVLSD